MEKLLNNLGAAAKRAAGAVSTGVQVAADEQKIKECYQALASSIIRPGGRAAI